jgi:hypothetical protein
MSTEAAHENLAREAADLNNKTVLRVTECGSTLLRVRPEFIEAGTG